MRDKEYKIQKNRIKKLKNKWFSNLGLGWWRITLNYYDEGKFSGKAEYSPKVVGGFWEAAFVTTCDPYYKTASIDCYLTILKDVSDDDLEEYFVHELMHIHLSLLHQKSTSEKEELVCTNLAQAFIWSTKHENN